EGHPPLYRFPESAIRSLASMCRYAEWKARPIESVRVIADFDDAAIERIVGTGEGWLPPEAVMAVLAACRLPVVPQRLAASETEAAAAARALGFPCVLKAVGAEIVHKSDIGGVALGLRDEAAVLTAARDMRA